MAKQNKKGPETTVTVCCAKCKSRLFRYRKGGKGALVKCFKQRISEDFTLIPCCCPNCENVFARDALIRGTPAFKIIGGKVICK